LQELNKIIARAKNKDRKAQGMLYAEFNVKWFMISLRYCSNRADASDVLQNALVKIFLKLDQFDSVRGNFSSWSSKIVVNESLMFLRQRSNAFKNVEVNDELLAFNENESPIDILSAEELTSLIQKLPDGYRTVFNLYVIEGYNHNEIADLLKITSGTSKSQLSKARKLLQQKLEVIL